MYRFVIVTALIALVSCSGGQPRHQESIDELLQVIELQRVATMNGDAKALVEPCAEEVTMVIAGKVWTWTRDELFERNSLAFQGMKILGLYNLQDPIVEMSADGSLAYVFLSRSFSYSTISPEDGSEPTSDYDASLQIWRRKDDRWQMVAHSATWASAVCRLDVGK